MEEINLDNKLVTNEDLESLSDNSEPDIENLWSDEDRLSKLNQEMEKLVKVKFPEYTEQILLQTLAEVLTLAGWTSPEKFQQTIKRIINRQNVPFSMLVKDHKTGKKDFWVQRVFVDCGNNFYSNDTSLIPKKEVLMSKQFGTYLRKYLKTQLLDQVHFWLFTTNSKGNQHLDPQKLTVHDREYFKDKDINDYVMFQFKKKTVETIIHPLMNE